MRDLAERIDLRMCGLPFENVIEHALRITWTRDPFDRIIAAQASVRSSRLVTEDEHILGHYPHAFWKES